MPVFSGYGYGQWATAEAGGEDVDVWTFGGSILAGLGNTGGFNVQGDLNYSTSEVLGVDLDSWNFGGAAFYRQLAAANGGPGFAFGASIGHTTSEVAGLDFDVTTYGVFGELYFSPMFTAFAQGGWADGDFDTDGEYIGGGLRVYPIPNLSLTGSIQYVSGENDSDATDFGIRGEFMFSPAIPVAVYAGYNNIDADGGDAVDVWTIGLRALFGPGMNLAEKDRNGPVRNANPVRFNF
jgi:hypothetical protein